MLNRVVLIGRTTKDPELRYTQSGTAVATFNLAVERPPSNGQKQTDFLPIVAWGKTAEASANYLTKGRLCAIDGRIQVRSYDNRDGQKVKVTEIVAESVRFLERGDKSAPTSQPPQRTNSQSTYGDDPFADDGQQIDISDDDLPF